ncbi:membrane protein of unknown function [Tenacibaculum jejuense]|uniref:Uncharacterized protein n=1 Tax=Tenacibaculum jejuense TaxID=584609 RepID=A0A238U534_9FLAO|nr:membrane protein of unknown function [Tenacibaculum jejuense]
MFFLGVHSTLILLVAFILLAVSFKLKEKHKSRAKIVFIFAISTLIIVPLNLINESYIFIAIFLGLPLLGILTGYY